MKNWFYLLLALSISFITAQDETTKELEKQQKQKEQQIQQEWQRYASPNENHTFLNFMQGEWKTVSNLYDDKGNVFRQDAGTCSNRWILGNRFLLIQHRFTQYGAVGVMGYDNYTHKFTAGYLDNQGTGTYLSQGDKQGDNSIVLTGDSISYFTGKPIKAKYVYTIIGENSYSFALFNISSEEKALKILDITYTKSNIEANQSYWTEKSKDVSKENEQSWNKYASANENHAALYPLAGNWKVSFYVYDEAGNIIRAPEGLAFNRTILGGRFALLHYKLDAYQGVGIMGYDNIKQKYTTLYINNFGTGIHYSEGSAKNKNKFLLFGSSIDYSTGKPVQVTYDTTVLSPTKYTFQQYDAKEKQELKIKKVHIECTKIGSVAVAKPKAEPKVPVNTPKEMEKAKDVVDVAKPKVADAAKAMADAKAKAAKIMADAQAKADKIMADAQAEAAKVLEEAKKAQEK